MANIVIFIDGCKYAYNISPEFRYFRMAMYKIVWKVAIQLRRIYGDGFYFWHHGTEIDFYVPDEQLAIQVGYSVQDAETRKREVNALMKMAGTMAVKKMVILTRDEEETIAEKEAIIQVIPVWKWLLG